MLPNASRMNQSRRESAVRRVRSPWRQFQRRQVTPASSHQTTSPGSGVSIAGAPSFITSNGSVPPARIRRGGASIGLQILATHGDGEGQADGVIEIHHQPGRGQGSVADDALAQGFRR